jgi:signal transduction histidine kinase
VTTTPIPGRLRARAATVGLVSLLVVVIGAVLVPGYRIADRLYANTVALRLASMQLGRPAAIAASLGTMRDRLQSGAYIGDTLDDLRNEVRDLDHAFRQLEGSAAANAPELQKARVEWRTFRGRLKPILAFDGLPYRDTDSGGAEMNAPGRKLLAETRAALVTGRTVTPQLTGALSGIGARLQAETAEASATLRTLLVAGVVFACLLVALLMYVQWLKTRHERAAKVAQDQMRDILATVKDGLFLLDADLRIGKAHSASLSSLLRRDSFEGLAFEDLLRDLVSEKVLATATKYVNLLWGDRVNENLIRSINPLNEVEVRLDRGDDRRDVKYLDFEFHRVRGGEGVRQVLVTVNDVTSRVLLTRELKDSQADSQSQVDMLLGILRADPRQVLGFLDDAAASLGHVNAVLKVPARNDGEFRHKIDELFREIHRIKGEAATLGLASVEARAHEFEDTLQALRERASLSGADFLPLVVRLDDLYKHLKAVRDIVERLDGLRADATLSAKPAAEPVSAATLEMLAQRVAGDQGKRVRVVASGLDAVPRDLAKPLRDILIQLVRNAVVHGIESAVAREAAGKNATGVLRVEFKPTQHGFDLDFLDDGAGIDEARVREVAAQRGLVNAEQAKALDSKRVLALLFRPGFSTRAAGDRDAGRGVGLDVVRRIVSELGGRIGVVTSAGKFTRFRITLPAASTRAHAVA